MYIFTRVVYFGIFSALNFMISFNLYKRRKKENTFIISMLFIILEAFCLFLLFKLQNMPAVFLDESNGMYDAWSLAKHGVDSNLIHNPIYLQSYAGQGQSILYAWIVRPFFLTLGYHLFVFRLPIVIISSLTMLLLFYTFSKIVTNPRHLIVVTTVIASSPWLLTTSRWGMDCNISPFPIMIGFCCIILATNKSNHDLSQSVLYLFGALALGLTAYSYNVSWLYLPILVPLTFLLLLFNKKINLKQTLIAVFAVLFEVLPITIFVFRSNITALNHTIKILFWTSPRLPVGRVKASFIDIHHDFLKHVVINIGQFIKMLLTGSDTLPWNSIPGFGAYYLFVLPFFLIGLIEILKIRSFLNEFILAMLIAAIPAILFIHPNFNHLMFIHFPILLIISIGIIRLIPNDNKDVLCGLLLSYLIMFVLFSNQYFDKTRYATTGWSVSTTQTIKDIKLNKYKKIYFASNSDLFLVSIRNMMLTPVSPDQFQKTKEHPYQVADYPKEKFLNFQKITPDLQLKTNSLILIDQNLLSAYANYQHQYDFVKIINIANTNYYMYKNSK